MNPFESGERKVIPAVLIYVKAPGHSGSGTHVLMIHRNAREKASDYHAGKWNGLGGKCELDESPLEAARRELREESDLDLPEASFRALGVLQFPNFKAHKSEDWMATVFVARVTKTPGALPEVQSSGEGSLHWIPEADLLKLNLWAGDREFIPLVQAEMPFIGTIWYDGDLVKRSWIQPL